MPDDVAHYSRYRFPPANISHAIWLYDRFTLSFRDVEDLLAQDGHSWWRRRESCPKAEARSVDGRAPDHGHARANIGSESSGEGGGSRSAHRREFSGNWKKLKRSSARFARKPRSRHKTGTAGVRRRPEREAWNVGVRCRTFKLA